MSEEIPQEIVEAATLSGTAAVNEYFSGEGLTVWTPAMQNIAGEVFMRAALAAARPMMVEGERDAIMDIVKAKAVAVKERISALLHNDEYEEADALGRHLRSLEDIFSEIRARKDKP